MRTKLTVCARDGASATEGGLETVVENSVVLDGSAMNQIINIDIENMQATAQWRSAGGAGKRVA